MARYGIPDNARKAHWGGIHDYTDDYDEDLWVDLVPLDEGGYTTGAYPKYFGIGEPVYHVQDEDGYVDFHIRASDASAARAEVLRMYPGARVWVEEN